MAAAAQPRILLVGEPIPPGVRVSLEGAAFAVTATPLIGIDPAEVSRSQGVLIAVSAHALNTAQALCRRWRIEFGEQYLPIVWLAADDVPPAAGLDSGADAVLPGSVTVEHVVAQLKALLRVHNMQSRFVTKAAEAQHLNQRLQQALRQTEEDSDLVRRIQRGLLPRSMPEVGRARFAVYHRPRSRIGGDFYDVVRLDEDHVGLYVADAMGRGLPTGNLLSIFVRQSLNLKETSGQSYRLVPPDEVLDRLNRELLGLNLPEPPFVTMVYAQLNCRDGSVVFARAAHPHPLLVPAGANPTYWHAAGTLLGVFESQFPVQQHQLRPGDRLVLFSDGVHPPSTGPGSLDDPLVESAKRHRSLGLQAFVDSVARDLLEGSPQSDDFTLLVLDYR
ncbi:MAG: SpoIIE family protein phosphatase [Zavarzinella sp.]|nr:SpoIIE family protein phosphatase [Zavarzinella sp.]